MIFFEENIFYTITHKQDYIKLENNKFLHYKISSDRQNQRWFIAVTLEDNGKTIIQQALSKQLKSYGECVEYIKQLPKLMETNAQVKTINNEMKIEFDTVCDLLAKALDNLNLFRKKYNL